MAPRISVALATYNGARHLDEQLRSLAEQTLLPAELVVSDDGSTDETLSIINAFARNTPFPVRILPKAERLGFSDNFLFAAENCRHELVAFCDQDDLWLPNKLRIAHDRLLGDNSVLALHTLRVTDGDLRPTGVIWTQEIWGDDVYEPLHLDPYINGWGNSMLFRRELVHLIPRADRPRQPQRPDLPLSHDTWIYVLGAALGRVSHILPSLLLYRQHGGNTYGVKAPGFRENLKRRFSAPVLRLREQALFNDRIVALFSGIASEAGPYAGPAKAAAATFAERRDLLRARTRLYTGPSVRSRLDAFAEVQRLAAAAPSRTRTRIKELLIGVSGFGNLTARLG